MVPVNPFSVATVLGTVYVDALVISANIDIINATMARNSATDAMINILSTIILD
jgi:hypothetical protein